MNAVIWICFHENCIALHADAGHISDLFVTVNDLLAREWLDRCLKDAEENDYAFLFREDADRLYDSICNRRHTASATYKNKDDLHGECYNICIYCLPIERLADSKLLHPENVNLLMRILSDRKRICGLIEKAWIRSESGSDEDAENEIEHCLVSENFDEFLFLLLSCSQDDLTEEESESCCHGMESI